MLTKSIGLVFASNKAELKEKEHINALFSNPPQIKVSQLYKTNKVYLRVNFGKEKDFNMKFENIRK